MSVKSRYDLGVVLSLTGDGSGTFVDDNGTTQNNGTLGAAYVASSDLFVGALKDLEAAVAFSMNTAAQITIKVEAERVDADNAGMFGWAPVLSVYTDSTGATSTAFEQVLKKVTLASGTIRLLLTDHRLSGKIRISAKGDAGGLSATDFVHVGVFAGGSEL